MGRLTLQRACRTVIVVLVVTVFTFSLARVTGDPAELLVPAYAPPEAVEILRKDLGLDRPFHVQYGLFLRDVVRGDLGRSHGTDQKVADMFLDRFPATLQLAGAGIAFTFILGVPLGLLAALYRGSVIDLLVRGFAALAQSTPSFWLAILLVMIFGVWLRWLPFFGKESPSNLILPMIALAVFPMAGVIRFVRSGMLEVVGQDYVRTARAKGLHERIVIIRHALRNALIPVVTYSGIVIVTYFLTGSLVIEVVFAWPGIGQLAFDSAIQRDFPTLMGLVLIFASMFALANFVVDMLYGFLDPRIRSA